MVAVFQKISTDVGESAPYKLAQTCHFLRDSAGWTIPLSGVNGSGPTGDNLGSGYMTTTTDWVCMESPDGAKQVIIGRDTNVNEGRVYYSPGANFSGGTGTSRATASDEVVVCGTGLMCRDFKGILALYADTEAPYGFYSVGWSDFTKTSVMNMRLVFDPLIKDSGLTSDPDPYIWHVGNNSPSGPGPFEYDEIASENDGSSPGSRCVGTLGSFSGTIPGIAYITGTGFSHLIVPGNGPADPDTQEDMAWPIFYARRTSLPNAGFKGVGSIIRWNGRNHTSIGSTMQNGTRILLWDVNLPWDGSVPYPA
jgi:hypothetical protein